MLRALVTPNEVVPVQFVTPPTDGWTYPMPTQHWRPHRYWRIGGLLAEPPQLAESLDNDEVLHLIAGDEQTTLAEAELEDCWHHMILDELWSIDNNATCTLTTLPAEHRGIGLMWVFMVKKHEGRAIVKHKARVTTKRYVQRARVHFEEVFALVTSLESMRLILALVAHRGWEVHCMDANSAFLSGDLEEDG